MTYYDELGVTQSASTEEIREAYRQLVKLLHPDHHQNNPELQRLAELQIKRLNEIVAILGATDSRREYDKSLNQEERSRPPAVSRQPAAARNRATALTYAPPRPGRRLFFSISHALNQGMWFLTLLIGAGALGWYFATGSAQNQMERLQSAEVPVREARDTAADDPLEELEDATVAEKTDAGSAGEAGASRRDSNPLNLTTQPSERLRQLERRLSQARVTREAALNDAEKRYATELAHLERQASQEQAKEARRSVEQTASIPPPQIEPAAPVKELAVTKNSPAPAADHGFRGRWTYRKAPKKKDDGLFAPEFIEMTIEMQGEVLWGSYRAKYQIPTSRKISPDVQFQFIGRPTRSAPQFLWSGQGGAKGVVELKIVDATSMEVNWTATNLGRRMGLVAGTAILERQP